MATGLKFKLYILIDGARIAICGKVVVKKYRQMAKN